MESKNLLPLYRSLGGAEVGEQGWRGFTLFNDMICSPDLLLCDTPQ